MKYNDALIEARLLVDEYLQERRGGRSKPKLIKQKRSKDSGKDVISKETAQDQRMKGLWKDFKDMKDRGEIRSTGTRVIKSRKEKGTRAERKRAALNDGN